MKVILEAMFFAGGNRYRKSNGKHDVRTIPDEFYERLPKSAIIVQGPRAFEEDPPEESPSSIATRAFKEAAHANDGKERADTDDAAAAHAAHAALARAEAADKPKKLANKK